MLAAYGIRPIFGRLGSYLTRINTIHRVTMTHIALQEQYYILYVKISRAHRRKFDASGEEIEPNFSETKKVNTGYLNSSYSKLILMLFI